MNPDTALLERILWGHVGRLLQGRAPPWKPGSAGARAVREVLVARELSAEEQAIVARWVPGREPSKQLFDRLLQARVNRAVQAGLQIAAGDLGLPGPPSAPMVVIARKGERLASARENGAANRPAPEKSLMEFLSNGELDPAGLEPGARLDQLVDRLVLANRDAAASLRATHGAAVSVARPEAFAGEGPEVELLAASSPSIQVFDIERELAHLEEILRTAIPAEARPAKSDTWSFEQDLTGALLGGKYRIRGLKGKGAFKTVYEGEDEMLGALVAVAVLNPKGARSPRALEHFQDEARKLTTIDHENIVRWITFDRTAEGLTYFVMEYLDGEELESVLRREGPMAPKRVAAILLQVVAALRRAHGGGKHGALLHLDLKPENVFVLPALVPGEPERVKVIDFGIGQNVGAEVRAAERPELRSLYDLPPEELGRSIGSLELPEEDEPEPAAAAIAPARRRVARARGGTLLYASPEQCRHLAGHKGIVALDGRSDLYSLGVMAFRMLTGQFPFARQTSVHEAIRNHLEVPPRRVGSLGIAVPRALAAFVDRCLVKDRAGRWRDAGEAHEALERIVRPRHSALRVALPAVALAGLGLGALYWSRAPVVSALTLVDPTIENVAERVVRELHLGPEHPARILRLESDAPWNARALPEPRLLDATSGVPLPGWSARWAGTAPNEVVLESRDDARSAAAVLELDGGRYRRWSSGRLALHQLGGWRIERVGVEGLADEEAAKRLDPRQRTLALELAGDAEGCAALDALELWLDGARLGLLRAVPPALQDARALYAGPALDALFTGAEREVALRLVARDRAGQEQETGLTLRLAGDAADFGTETGFVARAEPDSAALPAAGETLLLPDNALRLVASAPARVRLYLEPARTPLRELFLPEARRASFVTLAELGIAATSEHAGALRIELDDVPFVARVAPETRTRTLPFRFTPVAPSVAGQLVDADGRELDLRAGADEANPVRVGARARFLVRAPPGTNLWVAAVVTREGHAPGEPVRLGRSSGPFELELALPEEGAYRVTVQTYVLGAGDECGPKIPPEHVFRFVVDRTPPEVRIALEGAAEPPDANEPLFVVAEGGELAQRVRAYASDPGLAELGWELEGPGGERARGVLAPAAEVELPSLRAYQAVEGRYALTLVAADAAGNTARSTSAWEVARTGPELTLIEPIASGEERRWALGSARSWNVRVRAADANGVAAVSARFVYGEQAGPELALVPAGGELWELPERDRPAAHPWWSGKELTLELVARDRAGLASQSSEPGVVPEIPRAGALVIAPRERPAEAMVEVPTGGDYVFGGRSGEGRRPWIVPIARGALRPFYLDAREVSRGEFLAFLESREGFSDPRWWLDGAAPGAARAAELAHALPADPAEPATGIAWAEARAFAAWRGKRLPTLLEWEFALRGSEYRDAPAPAGPVEARAGWPASLWGGAREWTATPEALVSEALDFSSQCRLHPERLLAPLPGAPGTALVGTARDALAPRTDAHWVAGAGAGEAPSWNARSLRTDASVQEDVGFRCAVDQEIAHTWLDRGNYVVVE